MSAEQFRRLPIPAPKIIVQPDPAVRPTLVNIDTNVLTEKRPVTVTTTVLGRSVRVRAMPAQFSWQYGDGSQLTTTNPGGCYPDLSTAHAYSQAGTYTVQLQTTFTGEFSVRSGPWQPITGTATTTSPSVNITAEERRAVLIG